MSWSTTSVTSQPWAARRSRSDSRAPSSARRERQVVELHRPRIGDARRLGEALHRLAAVLEERHRLAGRELEEVVPEVAALPRVATRSGAEDPVVEAHGRVHVVGDQCQVVDAAPGRCVVVLAHGPHGRPTGAPKCTSSYLTRTSGRVAAVTRDLDLTGRPIELRDVDLDTFFRPSRVAVIGASDNRRPNDAMWRKIRDWAEKFDAEVDPGQPQARRRSTGSGATRASSTCPARSTWRSSSSAPRSTCSRRCSRRSRGSRSSSPPGSPSWARRARSSRRRLEAPRGHAARPTCWGRTPTSTPSRPSATTWATGRSPSSPSPATRDGPVFQSQELGVAMSHWAPAGNEADLEFADFARYFADLGDHRGHRGLRRGLQGRAHDDARRGPRGQGRGAPGVREGRPHRRGHVDGQEPHRSPDRLGPGHLGRVPPARA